MALPVCLEANGPFKGVAYTAMRMDGNCLYAAISLALFDDAALFHIVKHAALMYFSQNWHQFSDVADHISPEHYLQDMSRDRVWGGFNEVNAVSQSYNRRFIIISDGKKIVDIGPMIDPKPIFLRYSGNNHYDLYRGFPRGFSLEREDQIEPLDDPKLKMVPTVRLTQLNKQSETESYGDPKLNMNPIVEVPRLNPHDWPELGAPSRKRGGESPENPPNKRTKDATASQSNVWDPKLYMTPVVVISPLNKNNWPVLGSTPGKQTGLAGYGEGKHSNTDEDSISIDSDDGRSDSEISMHSDLVISDTSGDECSSDENEVLVDIPSAAESGSEGEMEDPLEDPASGPNRRRRVGPWCLPPHIITERPRLSFRPGTRKYSKCALTYGDEDFSLVKPVDFGECTYTCKHCGAQFWPAEITLKQGTTARCCNFGDYYLDKAGHFQKLPDEISSLYDGRHPQSKHFLDFIIAYNRIFSTVYSSGRFDYADKGMRGPHCLRINGEIKYVTSPFKSATKRRRPDGSFEELPGTVNHGHVYFLDLTVDAVKHRITNSTVAEKLSEDIVLLLENYLREKNAFIRQFKFAKEKYEEEKIAAEEEGREMKEVVLVINPKSKKDNLRAIGSHTYRQKIFEQGYTEQPPSDFIAAVFVGEVPEYSYDLRYFPRAQVDGDERQRAPHVGHSTLDTQMYPLIYLHGEFAWLKSKKKKDYTPTVGEYANFRLGRRENVPILFKSKRLFLHWLINCEIRREYNQLEYFRQHQVELRLDTYKNIRDYALRAAADQNKQLGRMIIIPPNFEGTTKHRREVFLDFITIMNKFGPATYFVTFTTNTQWKEIVERCNKENTLPKYRPDICNDVFMLKWLSFMSDMVHNQVVGEVVAHFTVFEAQNRLLMHAHSIFIMKEGDRPMTGDDVDRVIWAHLPDPDQDPELYALVVKLHIHGPCTVERGGSFKWMCRANKDDKCRYDYPMPFRKATSVDARKTAYRRLDDGNGFYKFINNQRVRIDNRWVVPYNPFSLKKSENNQAWDFFPKAGIARYLAKYFTKSGHTENVHITNKNKENKDPKAKFEYDEVRAYKEMRTLGACEAHFRLSGRTLFDMSIAVEKLPIHLEGEQNMVFHENKWVQAKNRDSTSTLTAWFELNQRDEANRDRYYYEVVEDHKWEKRTWVRTKTARSTIGRICTVEPNIHSMELFYMRILLTNRKGCTGFADVRKIDGIQYKTYQEACVALGLLDDDVELRQVLLELEGIATGFQLRRVFSTLLVHATPKNPLPFWYEFADSLSQDYYYKTRKRESSIASALKDLETLLNQLGRTLEQYGLPNANSFVFASALYPKFVPIRPPADIEDVESESSAEDKFKNLWTSILEDTKLNVEQEDLSKRMIDAIEGRTSEKLFFLCAAAGTGKTTLLNYISAYCNKHEINHKNVAYTGLASTLLLSGGTAHKTFQIPLHKEDYEATTSNMKLQSKEADKLRSIKYFVWDECSMICAWQLEVVDHLMRTLKKCDEPFGGVVVVLAGDLRQLLPVIKGASRPEVVENAVMSSRLWHLFVRMTLKQNMRTGKDEQEFAEWLLDVAEGRKNVPGTDEINLPLDLLLDNVQDLITFTFPHFKGTDYLHSVILSPTNEAADRLNNIILDMFTKNTPYTEYLSATSILCKGKNKDLADKYDTLFLQNLSSGSLPLHALRLKVGVPVLLLRNIDPVVGLCNGTKMVVRILQKHAIKCEILNGIHAQKCHWIHRIYFDTNEFGLTGTLRRKQFPLRLAFALTINRSQGQTVLKQCGIYLSVPPFTHEMLYVALSRATKRTNVRIHVGEAEGQGRRNRGAGGDPSTRRIIFTQNPIYFEILEHIPDINLEFL